MPVRRQRAEGIIVYKDRFCIALGRIEYYFRITARTTIKLRAAMTLLARVFVSAIALIAASSASAATFEELAAQANAAREADNIPQAIQLYQEALQLKPAWPDGWWYLGTIFYDGDQYENGRQGLCRIRQAGSQSRAGMGFPGSLRIRNRRLTRTRWNTSGVDSRSARALSPPPNRCSVSMKRCCSPAPVCSIRPRPGSCRSCAAEFTIPR